MYKRQVELFERMAYYAVFIVLTIYLSTILGFNDFEASMISGLFSGGLYLLPIFSGAYADTVSYTHLSPLMTRTNLAWLYSPF